jgi:hypothetical protein
LCHSRVSGNPGPRHVRPSLDARFRGHDTDVSESSPHFQRLTRLGLRGEPARLHAASVRPCRRVPLSRLAPADTCLGFHETRGSSTVIASAAKQSISPRDSPSTRSNNGRVVIASTTRGVLPASRCKIGRRAAAEPGLLRFARNDGKRRGQFPRRSKPPDGRPPRDSAASITSEIIAGRFRQP